MTRDFRSALAQYAALPPAPSPFTASLVEAASGAAENAYRRFMRFSLPARLFALRGGGEAQRDFLRLASADFPLEATFAQATRSLKTLYAAYLPLSFALAESAEPLLERLERRGFGELRSLAGVRNGRMRSDFNALWGVVRTFKAVRAALRAGSEPDNIYFRSAWIWFRRRNACAAHCVLELSEPRFGETFDEPAPRAALFERFCAEEQPFAEAPFIAPNALQDRALWSSATRLLSAQADCCDALARALWRRRSFLLELAAHWCLNGILKAEEDFWLLTLDQAQDLARAAEELDVGKNAGQKRKIA